MPDLGRVVLDLLNDEGDVQLPSLTREEFYALGDEPVLADAVDVRWWEGLDQASRDLVAETAQRSLIARNLIVANPDDGAEPPLVVADRVQVILKARHEPAWLLVVGEPREDKSVPPTQVAVTGIDLRAHATSAVLISTRIAGIYANRITRPDIAVVAVVDWLLQPPADGAATVGRTAEIMLPTDLGRSRVADVRAIVLTGAGAGAARLALLDENGEPGEPQPVDHASLRGWLIDTIATLGVER